MQYRNWVKVDNDSCNYFWVVMWIGIYKLGYMTTNFGSGILEDSFYILSFPHWFLHKCRSSVTGYRWNTIAHPSIENTRRLFYVSGSLIYGILKKSRLEDHLSRYLGTRSKNYENLESGISICGIQLYAGFLCADIILLLECI